MGFLKRRISIKIIDFLRHVRGTYHYFKDYFYENSFRKGKIKSLLTIQEGAVGDTYDFIATLNEVARKYPHLKIYCLTRAKTQNFYKNPKLHVISPPKAEKLIKEGKIDSLVSYGDLGNFFKKKSIVFNIPNRAGKLFPYKTRLLANEILDIFKKLGIKVNNQRFYHTKVAKKVAKKFYKENKIKNPVFIHVGSGKTIRALKEGKVPSHYWNPKKWARIADLLIERDKCTIIFTGVKEESGMIKEVISLIKNKKKVIDISGKFSIEEVASIVKGNLTIGIDSGIMHILSQISQTIMLYAGNPQISRPHKNSINIWSGKGICNGCRKYYCPYNDAVCINSIKMGDVLKYL